MFRTVGVLTAVLVAVPNVAAAKEPRAPRVVVVTLPGMTWADVRDARTPALDDLVRRGAVGALATRTVSPRPGIARGYMTLGAGNRAYVANDDPVTEEGYAATAEVEADDARSALERRTGRSVRGGIVHLGVPELQTIQDARLYDARIGALGEALGAAGIRRAVVAATDLGQPASGPERRRSVITALADADGVVDDGVVEGLLRPDASAPYGVRVDEGAFVDAVVAMLERNPVVLADPGETARADEYVPLLATDRIGPVRLGALERADAAIGRLVEALPRDTVLMVLAPSPPAYPETNNRLTPIVVTGTGFEPGWLTSSTTRQAGQVALTDVAPTLLATFGIEIPEGMSGTPMSDERGAGASERVAVLDELDAASVFREQFASAVFYVLAVLLSLLAILAFVVFLGGFRRGFSALAAVAYFGLAIFPAAHVVRAVEYWRFGQVGAHALLYGVAAVLALGAWRVPGPRWAGGAALLLGSAAAFALDFYRAGPLQVNGVFGHSPVVAGRFYGAGNVGVTILYSALILGLMGYGELRRWRAAPWWVAGAFVVAIVGVGLPQFGADFGGMATGVAAAATTMTLARRRRIGWRWVTAVAGGAVLLTAAATAIDLTRPPDARTHLGRFASTVAEGGFDPFRTIVMRKATAQLGSLGVTRWTYFIPVGLAVLVLLVWKPRGVLRDVLPSRPMLRAGLWGALVAGMVGFSINDSGISIPALTLAHAVGFLVLFAVEAHSPRPPPKTAVRMERSDSL